MLQLLFVGNLVTMVSTFTSTESDVLQHFIIFVFQVWLILFVVHNLGKELEQCY